MRLLERVRQVFMTPRKKSEISCLKELLEGEYKPLSRDAGTSFPPSGRLQHQDGQDAGFSFPCTVCEGK